MVQQKHNEEFLKILAHQNLPPNELGNSNGLAPLI
jgi:hypothetical protein